MPLWLPAWKLKISRTESLRQGEVLVAILNQPRDLEIAREQHWYRIPIQSVERFLKQYWEPDWLAFYQTKIFGDEAYKINYYTRVLAIQTVCRQDLFPDEPRAEQSQKQYYKLKLAPLEPLPQPIINPRQRRITFIPTTLSQLMTATEVSDLSMTRLHR